MGKRSRREKWIRGRNWHSATNLNRGGPLGKKDQGYGYLELHSSTVRWLDQAIVEREPPEIYLAITFVALLLYI